MLPSAWAATLALASAHLTLGLDGVQTADQSSMLTFFMVHVLAVELFIPLSDLWQLLLSRSVTSDLTSCLRVGAFHRNISVHLWRVTGRKGWAGLI